MQTILLRIMVIAVVFFAFSFPGKAEDVTAPETPAETLTTGEAQAPQGSLFAKFKIEEQSAGQITVGQKAQVFVDAFPDQTFEGTVESVAGGIAKVRIENPKGELANGMFARIECNGLRFLASLSAS